MIEKCLIKCLLDTELYTKYYHHIPFDYIKEVNKEFYKILLALKHLKEHSEATSHTVEDLALTFYQNYPVLAEDKFFRKAFEEINNTSIDVKIVTEYLQKFKDKAIAAEIFSIAHRVTEGQAKIEELWEVTDDNRDKEDSVEEAEFVSDDLSLLANRTLQVNGLRWRLDCLNKSCGSIRSGNFVLVVARPETGKTAFVCSEATFMSSQLLRPVLWFNNEEQGDVVMEKIYMAALGVTRETLLSDIPASKKKYTEITKNNIKLIDSAYMDKNFVLSKIKKHKPGLIIFDQLDKIKGFKADRKDLELGNIYQWARELAKQYCPVIALSQANGDAEGKKWLETTSLSNSRTDKPAEPDVIIGIGKIPDAGFEQVRYIHLMKNKLRGDDDTKAEHRHLKVEVLLDSSVMRFSDRYKI